MSWMICEFLHELGMFDSQKSCTNLHFFGHFFYSSTPLLDAANNRLNNPDVTCEGGSAGPKVSINKALLLSALSIDPQLANIGTGISYAEGVKYDASGVTFASETYADAMKLEDVSVGVFTKALENLATLRADNGGTMSRLQYASDNAQLQAKNFAAANGRIVDVDIAAESTNLAKYQILSQASASMIAQANSSMDIALMLLR